VKPTEHTTKTPKATTPLFAMLCGLLHNKRTGATLFQRTKTLPQNPHTRRLLPTIAITFAALTLTATPALAGSAHIYSHTLGEGRGEAAGELQLTPPVEFNKKTYGSKTVEFNVAGSGVAVNDETHDVYVADTGNHRVDEFEADGNFIQAFGAGVGPLGQDTCTTLSTCKAGATGSGPGDLEAPVFVAVDNSTNPSDPSKGDVYVGTGVGKEASNEHQYLEFPGANEGTYTLSFEGETTAPIPYVQGELNGSNEDGPDSQAAQKALEALPSIGKGNVDVSEHGATLGTNLPGQTEWLKVEFVGALKETAVAKLGCDPSGLTPAGAACEVEIGQSGAHHVGEIIAKFNADGTLQASWGDTTPTPNGQLTGKNASEGPFGNQLNGIAVDSSGDLWVYNNGGVPNQFDVMYEFEQDGVFKENFKVERTEAESPMFESASGIAVGAPGELYIARTYYQGVQPAESGIALDTAEGEVYEDSGTSIKSAGESFTSPELEAGGGAGLAVDSSVGTAVSSGTVYVANASSDRVEAFGIALGVNPSGPGSATGVTAAAATLNGVVNPEGLPVTECYFGYGETSEYSQSAPCAQGLGENSGEIGKGTSPVPVSAKLSGLHGGVVYHYRLLARNANGIVEGADETFTTPTVPVVTGAEVANLTEGGAELRANVNPEGLQVSRCVFEYGTSTAYGAREPCEQRKSAIGSGTVFVPVSAQISGLAPNTTYYWRLRVEDVDGEAFEPGHTFSYPTTSAGAGGLPDGRAYEMVTPPFKNGALVGGQVIFGNATDVSEDGSRVIAKSIQCFGDSQSCTALRGEKLGEPFEFTRTARGWVTSALAPPASEFSENSPWRFDAEEGSALFSAPTGVEGEEEWYARSPQGVFSDLGPAVPPGSDLSLKSVIATRGQAATTDLSHLVFESEYEGPGSFWPFDHTEMSTADSSKSLYEYTSGTGDKQPFLVGVTGGYEEGKNYNLISDCGTLLGAGGRGGGGQGQWNALSEDGRMVYFTAVCDHALYARVDGEGADAHTVAISAPGCGDGTAPADAQCRNAPPGEAEFAGASRDGSRAFFLDTQQLTDEATRGEGSTGSCDEGGSACNLYLSECTTECEQAGEQRRLIDVSAAEANGESPRVQAVLASSADGSHVYFVANGVLTARPNAQGAKASPGHCLSLTGTCNLYVYGEGHVAFITAISGAELGVYSKGSVVNVTPEGRFLVFEHAGQVYRYDAQSGQLLRVSIGQDGYNDNGDGGVGQALIVPTEFTLVGVVGPLRGDPTMSNDGARVFFMSPVALTPHALDDVVIGYENSGGVRGSAYYAENVYEWEQEGHGSCAAGQSSGCVYLISDGHDTSVAPTRCQFLESVVSGSCLLGSDATGDNVFIQTTDRLVPADTDTQEDIYDARVCEPENGNPCIAEPPPALPPCDGENCHGIPEPTPSLLAPGTASFNGEGNVAPSTAPPLPKRVTKKTATCKRGYVKKKVKKKEQCVRKKSDGKAKKSAHGNRRAPR
jgi:hypothetical protein